jgi:hypothetical protein
MGPRLALVALIAAFSIAVAVAALTTIRQVNTATSSLTRLVTHI